MRLRHHIFAVTLLFTAAVTVFSQETQFKQFSTKEGLSHDYVTAMGQDIHGRLWVGTRNGLNLISNSLVYNYFQAESDGIQLLSGNVTALSVGEKIVVAMRNGLFVYDELSDSFHQILFEEEPVCASAVIQSDKNLLLFESNRNSLLNMELSDNSISIVQSYERSTLTGVSKLLRLPETDDRILIVTSEHGMFEYYFSSGSTVHIDSIPNHLEAKATFIDSHSRLWASPYNDGVRCYDTNDGYVQLLSFTEQNSEFNDNAVLSISEVKDVIYVSTDGGGINCIGIENNITHIESPLTMSTTCLSTGLDGSIIAGTTYNGVIFIKDNFITTLRNYQEPQSETILSNSIILSAYEDPEFGVWLGTDGGGINLYNDEEGTITSYPPTYGRKVNCICPFDKEHLLLMLYNEGLHLFDKRTYTITPFQAGNLPSLDFSLPEANFVKMTAIGNGDIVFYNWAESNYLYKRQYGTFISFKSPEDDEGKPEILVNFDVQPQFTVASSRYSLYEINNTTLSVRILYSNPVPIKWWCFSADRKAVWFLDENGLARFDRERNTAERVSKVEESPLYSILTVDNKGNVWICKDGGTLLSYNPSDDNLRYYSASDGVEERYFSRRVAMSTPRGKLIFTGFSSLMIVSPNKLSADERYNGEVSLLCANIGNTPAQVDKRGRIIVPNKFSALNIKVLKNVADPSVHQSIRYHISGRFPEKYEESASEEFIFHWHPQGRYDITVSTLTHKGWTPYQTIATVCVKPPLWLSWQLCVLYLLAAGIIVLARRRQSIRSQERKDSLARQEKEKQQIEERVMFMTNIAHELRTPLTLIQNPVRRIMEDGRFNDDSYNALKKVSHQISKMGQMINMALDIQKMDVTGSSLFIEPVGINRWIKSVSQEFEMEMKEKGLNLDFDLDEKIGDVNLDKTKIEVVFNNLMMNAIKYSDSGTITVSTSRPEKGFIKIAVTDEGCGFNGNPDMLFQRFYQSDNSNVGYGIGLSYARMLIEKHGGRISAAANKKVGSTFWFEIPSTMEVEPSMLEYRIPDNTDRLEEVMSDDNYDTRAQTLLIVDNQQSILHYIKSEYINLFKHIYTAENGEEALDIIKYKLPSIVVSDVIMPVMNGFELCKSIKNDLTISHIPIILLTARNDPDNQEMGYKLGADCFVPKPFDINMLYYIIRNQLRNRAEIKRQYADTTLRSNTADLTFSLADEKFMIKLNKFINNNISDPGLDIDKILDHMCISKSTLFYKMNDLTGMSTGRYIRKIRIDMAKDMLRQSENSISDISLKLGFAESRYFSTVFKQETGETPTQYKKRVRLLHN